MAKKARRPYNMSQSKAIIWSWKQRWSSRHRGCEVKAEKKRKRPSSMHSSSSTPLDICMVILYYLPPKSLIRFRSVSRSWNSIIKEPNFAFSHQLHWIDNRSKERLIVNDVYSLEWSVICSNTFEKISRIESPPIENRSCVLGSRDGLMLLGSSHVLRKVDDATLILCNPSIRKSVYITPPPILLSEDNSMAVLLGFDPSEHDYKLVTLVYNKYDISSSYHVFSLKSRSWVEVSYTMFGKSPYHQVEHHHRNNVSIGEYIHWIGRVFNEYGRFRNYTLVSLNLMTRTIFYTRIPGQLNLYQEFQDKYDKKKFWPVLLGQQYSSSSIGLLVRSGIWELERLHNIAAGLQPCWKKIYDPELKLDGLVRNYLYLTKDGLLLSRGFKKVDVLNLKTGQGKKFPYSTIKSSTTIFINAYIESSLLLNWR